MPGTGKPLGGKMKKPKPGSQEYATNTNFKNQDTKWHLCQHFA